MEGPWAGTGRDPWDGHFAPLALAGSLGRKVANRNRRANKKFVFLHLALVIS
ncbi:hypothetical protein BDP67DRAFT_190897 [Colletotrichum lupini]|nr:hypothetical protein BDP67DRAFT_190897 [Colletotrichum lupini]